MMLGSDQVMALEGVWSLKPFNYYLYLLNAHLCFPFYVFIADFSIIIKKNIKLSYVTYMSSGSAKIQSGCSVSRLPLLVTYRLS